MRCGRERARRSNRSVPALVGTNPRDGLRRAARGVLEPNAVRRAATADQRPMSASASRAKRLGPSDGATNRAKSSTSRDTTAESYACSTLIGRSVMGGPFSDEGEIENEISATRSLG
jgi:hypothetical protein